MKTGPTIGKHCVHPSSIIDVQVGTDTDVKASKTHFCYAEANLEIRKLIKLKTKAL